MLSVGGLTTRGRKPITPRGTTLIKSVGRREARERVRSARSVCDCVCRWRAVRIMPPWPSPAANSILGAPDLLAASVPRGEIRLLCCFGALDLCVRDHKWQYRTFRMHQKRARIAPPPLTQGCMRAQDSVSATERKQGNLAAPPRWYAVPLCDQWCRTLTRTQVQSLHGKRAVDVSCGFAHSVAILSGGLMVVWGSAVTGKLGLGPVTDEYECFCPIPTPLVCARALCTEALLPIHVRTSNQPLPMGKRVLRVSCAHSHTGCVTEDGKVFIWGCGDSGRLGLGR